MDDVDKVTYADEGDWATRNFDATNGCVWTTGANWKTGVANGGRSMELRNPAVTKNNGQNWGESAAAGGTPGAENSNRTTNIAPIVSNMKHSPRCRRVRSR